MPMLMKSPLTSLYGWVFHLTMSMCLIGGTTRNGLGRAWFLHYLVRTQSRKVLSPSEYSSRFRVTPIPWIRGNGLTPIWLGHSARVALRWQHGASDARVSSWGWVEGERRKLYCSLDVGLEDARLAAREARVRLLVLKSSMFVEDDDDKAYWVWSSMETIFLMASASFALVKPTGLSSL